MASEYDIYKKEHSLFTWTKPVGYDFIEVDKAIDEYKKTISDVYEIIADRDNTIAILEGKNSDLQRELTLVNCQLDEYRVPTYSEEQSLEILNDFNQESAPQQTIQQPQQTNEPTPIQPQTSNVPEMANKMKQNTTPNTNNKNDTKNKVVSNIIGAITYEEIKQQTDGNIIM